MRLEEIYFIKDFSVSDFSRIKGSRQINVDIRTRFFNAERVAFSRVRKLAKKLGYENIFYSNWSRANPDFMNGDDEAIPHRYNIEAVLF